MDEEGAEILGRIGDLAQWIKELNLSVIPGMRRTQTSSSCPWLPQEYRDMYILPPNK